MDSNSKIFVAGHKGLVGSAIVRNLQSKGYDNIITLNRSQLDLTNQKDVKMFFMMEQPEYVFLQLQRLVASWVIKIILQILYTKI